MASVLIVGAGPAGAALAFLLARRGIEVTLLERHSDFEREFRGEVLMPSAIEGLHQMGLAEAFAAVPQVCLRRLQLYLFGRSILDANIAQADLEIAPAWVSQPHLLEMLVERAAEFPSFRLERGVSARDVLRQGERIVGVRVKNGDAERELRADLLVGADGRASVVRKRSGVEVLRDGVVMDIVWCKLPLPEFMARDPHLRAYLGHGHLLVAAPTPDERLQLGWVIRKGTFGELRSRGMDEWMEELADHVSPDLAEHLRWHRDDTLRPFLLDTTADCVKTWRPSGALLLGDAAHTMSPVGGQGLNIALRDALVAANELVPVLGQGADLESLDAACARIESERMPEVRTIQSMQARAPLIVLNNSWWARYALRILPLLLFGRRGGGAIFQRFANGVTDVELRV